MMFLSEIFNCVSFVGKSPNQSSSLHPSHFTNSVVLFWICSQMCIGTSDIPSTFLSLNFIFSYFTSPSIFFFMLLRQIFLSPHLYPFRYLEFTLCKIFISIGILFHFQNLSLSYNHLVLFDVYAFYLLTKLTIFFSDFSIICASLATNFT